MGTVSGQWFLAESVPLSRVLLPVDTFNGQQLREKTNNNNNNVEKIKERNGWAGFPLVLSGLVCKMTYAPSILALVRSINTSKAPF